MTHVQTAESDGRLVTICVSGEIDLATELHALDADLVDKDIRVDASGVTFAGSTFLAWLIHSKIRARSLTLVQPSAAAWRVIELAKLTTEFDVER